MADLLQYLDIVIDAETLPPVSNSVDSDKVSSPTLLVRGDVKRTYEDVPLAKLNAITGKSGDGKTGLVKALKLAFSGEDDETGALPSALLALAVDKTQGITCEIAGPKATAKWRLRVEDGQAKKPSAPEFTGEYTIFNDPAARYSIFPVQAVRDFFNNVKDKKRIRESLLSWFGSGLTELPTPTLFEPLDVDNWQSALETCKGANVDETLSALTEHFRTLSGSLNREVSLLEKTLAIKRKTLGMSASGVEQLPKLEKDLIQALEYSKYSKWTTEQAAIKLDLAELDAKLDTRKLVGGDLAHDYANAIEQLDANFDSTQLAHSAANQDYLTTVRKAAFSQEVRNLYLSRLESGKTKCPFSPYDLGSIDTVRAYAEEWARRASTKEVEEVSAKEALKMAAESLASATTTRDRVRHEREVRMVEFNRENEGMARLRVTLGLTLAGLAQQKIAEVAEPVGLKSALSLVAYTTSLEVKIATLTKSLSSKKEVDQDGQNIYAKTKQYDSLKRLEGKAEEIQKEIMGTVAERASAELTKCCFGNRRVFVDPVSCELMIYDRNSDGSEAEPHPFKAMSGVQQRALKFSVARFLGRGTPLRIALFGDADTAGFGEQDWLDFYTACDEAQACGDFDMVCVESNFPNFVPKNGKWNTLVNGTVMPNGNVK